MSILSVGIASADPLHLGDALDLLVCEGIEWAHIDVMDGVYCPMSATADARLGRAVAERMAVDVHLMVEDPLAHVDAWADAGARMITFQLEATRHPHRVLQWLAGRDVMRGVAIAPGTPVAMVEPLLDELELVLVLAVNPGWGGQRLGPAALQRVAAVRELAAERDVMVGVDGGITVVDLAEVLAAGPDVVVAGSAIFGDSDPAAAARRMRAALGRAGDSTVAPKQVDGLS